MLPGVHRSRILLVHEVEAGLRLILGRQLRLGRQFRLGYQLRLGRRLRLGDRFGLWLRFGLGLPVRLLLRRSKLDREFFCCRKIGEPLQPEVLEESIRRAVQQRASQSFPTTHHGDQLPVQQRPKNRTRADAPHVLDLDATDRLAIGDDRQ